MLIPFLAGALLVAPVSADTTIALGIVTRDLTGDTTPEVITLTGVGQTIDDLTVSFTIRSSGHTLYTKTWHLTRARYDGGRRPTDAEHRASLREYGKWFFDDSKFMSPERFVSELRSSARLHIPLIPEVISHQMTPRDSSRARMIWDQMQTAGITIFEFSPGGDLVMSIGSLQSCVFEDGWVRVLARQRQQQPPSLRNSMSLWRSSPAFRHRRAATSAAHRARCGP